VPSYNGLGLAAGTPYANFPMTGNSYFACLGSCLEYDATDTASPPNGLFSYSGTVNAPPVRLADVRDGLSNTIAFAEWRLGTGNQGVTTIPQDVFFSGSGAPASLIMSQANYSAIQTWLTACMTSGTRGPRTVTIGQYWSIGLPILTLGNVILGPNAKYANCASTNSYNSSGVYSWSSYHSGGCNAVLGDGSVRFFKDSINPQTVWALGSRAQGEVLSSDSF
jgi:prepilin-type processing-associated H-X9-DG protein